MTVAVREVTSTPRLGPLYARAASGAALGALRLPLPRAGGDRRRGDDAPDHLPGDELVQRDVTVDRDHVAAFAAVCGFRLRDELPLPYLHVLAFPLAVVLMTDRAFPFALPGLVHVGNRTTAWRAVTADDRPTLRVRTVDLRAHRRGRQFDVETVADVGGTAVWEERSTYLKRARGSSDGAERPTEQTGDDDGKTPAPGDRPDATWRVARDVGRRYAAVSGDRNPIHLSRLAARLLGFPRPIAHGMWTAARCIAAIEHRLPDAVTVEVAFRKPVLLPTTVGFSATSDGSSFSLRSVGSGALHLEGSATPA